MIGLLKSTRAGRLGAAGVITSFDLTHPKLLTSAEVGFPSERLDDAVIDARNTKALQFVVGLVLLCHKFHLWLLRMRRTQCGHR